MAKRAETPGHQLATNGAILLAFIEVPMTELNQLTNQPTNQLTNVVVMVVMMMMTEGKGIGQIR